MEDATWAYKGEDGQGAATTHIGLMAEEFHEAFDVGDSDDHINSVNADGVAFAAIQGLSSKLDETNDELEEALRNWRTPAEHWTMPGETRGEGPSHRRTGARQCDAPRRNGPNPQPARGTGSKSRHWWRREDVETAR